MRVLAVTACPRDISDVDIGEENWCIQMVFAETYDGTQCKWDLLGQMNKYHEAFGVPKYEFKDLDDDGRISWQADLIEIIGL